MQTVRFLRAMAWQRAKGELHALLSTYYSPENCSREQFYDLDNKINAFIKEVEDEGLAE